MAAARTCGPPGDRCQACCKLPALDELRKPPGAWCPHAKAAGKGGGCAIHDRRFPSCRAFLCHWITDRAGVFGPQDRPDKSKVILVGAWDGSPLTVFVDPGYPGREREGKVGEIVRNWLARGGRVDIVCGARVTRLGPAPTAAA